MSEMARAGMTIGEASKRSGCAVSQIRYYEEIGLLRQTDRTAEGRRVFGWPDIKRLQLLRRLRTFGFGLKQINSLIRQIDAPDPTCDTIRSLAEEHLIVIEQRKNELMELEKTLTGLTRQCGQMCNAGIDPKCLLAN